MKKYTISALVILLVLGFAVNQAKATLSYDLKYVFNGNTPAGSNWLKAEFNTVTPGEVSLKLTSNFTNSSYYFQQVGFNVDPGITPGALGVAVTNKSGFDTDPTISKSTQNGQALPGSGNEMFDVLLSFSTSNGQSGDHRFNNSDMVTFTITGSGITEDSFNFLSSTGKANVGAHIAWGEGSGAISNVPIPGAVWLLGTGLIGLVGVRRRFQD